MAKTERNQPAMAAIRESIGTGWRQVRGGSTKTWCRRWRYHEPARNSLRFNADRVVAKDRGKFGVLLTVGRPGVDASFSKAGFLPCCLGLFSLG